jgi:hypothetical protein
VNDDFEDALSKIEIALYEPVAAIC